MSSVKIFMSKIVMRNPLSLINKYRFDFNKILTKFYLICHLNQTTLFFLILLYDRFKYLVLEAKNREIIWKTMIMSFQLKVL